MSLRLNSIGNWSYSEQHCTNIIAPYSPAGIQGYFPMRLIAVLFASLYMTSGAWADIPVQAPSETEVTKSLRRLRLPLPRRQFRRHKFQPPPPTPNPR